MSPLTNEPIGSFPASSEPVTEPPVIETAATVGLEHRGCRLDPGEVEGQTADVAQVRTGRQHVQSLELMDEAHEAGRDRGPFVGRDRVDRAEKIAVIGGIEQPVHRCGRR